MNKVVYVVDDIQKMLNIGKNQAYNLVKSGQFVTKRIGRRIVIPCSSFDEWLGKTS